MSYVFDPDSGATHGDLVELVLGNSFSESRYSEQVHTWLNDAVTDVCRRLRIQRGYQILSFDATGLVTQPASPFFHLDEIWLARTGSSGFGEQAFSQGAYLQLEPLAGRSPADFLGYGSPLFYTTRRGRLGDSDRYSALTITVLPVSTSGLVAVTGLQRPPIMNGDSKTSGLGADLDDALVAYAKARCFRAEDDFEMRDRWMAEYESALRSVAYLDDDDEPNVVDGTWDC